MTDTYITLFVNSVFAKTDPQVIFSVFFLFLARMLPIIAQAPFFGSRVLPNPTKLFLALTLFVIFLPHFLLSFKSGIGFNMTLLFLMFKELFIGLVLGFLISIPFIIVQAAGILVDHQRGGASLMVNDPTVQNQSSPLGTLFNMVLIVVFYLIDGPFLFLDAFLKSYEIIPPDQFINPAFFANGSPMWKLIVQLFNQTMTMAIQLSAPALIAILMTDVFLGIANRLAPQVQITFLGMPLKSLLGLLVICLGWQLLTSEFARQIYIWMNTLIDTIGMFGIQAAATS